MSTGCSKMDFFQQLAAQNNDHHIRQLELINKHSRGTRPVQVPAKISSLNGKVKPSTRPQSLSAQILHCLCEIGRAINQDNDNSARVGTDINKVATRHSGWWLDCKAVLANDKMAQKQNSRWCDQIKCQIDKTFPSLGLAELQQLTKNPPLWFWSTNLKSRWIRSIFLIELEGPDGWLEWLVWFHCLSGLLWDCLLETLFLKEVDYGNMAQNSESPNLTTNKNP